MTKKSHADHTGKNAGAKSKQPHRHGGKERRGRKRSKVRGQAELPTSIARAVKEIAIDTGKRSIKVPVATQQAILFWLGASRHWDHKASRLTLQTVVSRKRLAELTKLGRDTVSLAVRALEGQKLIVPAEDGGWFLQLPAGQSEATGKGTPAASDDPATSANKVSDDPATSTTHKVSDDPTSTLPDHPTDGGTKLSDHPADGGTIPLSSSIPRSFEASSSSLDGSRSSSSDDSTGCARGGGSAALAAAAAAEAAEGKKTEKDDKSGDELKLKVKFDKLLGGPKNYQWKEHDQEFTIDTLIGYFEVQGDEELDRKIHIRWTWDRNARRLFASFPRSGLNAEVQLPMSEVERVAKETWSRFAGEEHGYSHMDFLICVEKLVYAWTRKENLIHTPVGFLGAVGRDVLDRKWGNCLFEVQWAARPREKKETPGVRTGTAAERPQAHPKAGSDSGAAGKQSPLDEGLEAMAMAEAAHVPYWAEFEREQAVEAAQLRRAQEEREARQRELLERELEKAKRIAEFERRQAELAGERRRAREAATTLQAGTPPMAADDTTGNTAAYNASGRSATAIQRDLHADEVRRQREREWAEADRRVAEELEQQKLSEEIDREWAARKSQPPALCDQEEPMVADIGDAMTPEELKALARELEAEAATIDQRVARALAELDDA